MATEMDPLEKAVKITGSQRALAELIGVNQQNVSYWLKSKVPAEYVIKIEKATKGKIKRHELRSDIYPVEIA